LQRFDLPNLFMPPVLNRDMPRLPATFVPCTRIAQLTGAQGVSSSVPYDVTGTDTGIVTRYQGQWRFIFGDTFGAPYFVYAG
jgi:hypothetical protein